MKISKRSGGPRTTHGKLISSRNALKSGAYSATIILPGEDEEEFKQLEEQFVQDFAPRDIAEGAMVHELAVLTWKRLRLERLEHAALIRTLNKRISPDEYWRENVHLKEKYEWVLNDLSILAEDSIVAQRAIQRSIEELEQVERNQRVINAMPRKHPELFQALAKLAHEYFIFDDPGDEPSIDVLMQLSLKDDKGQQISYLDVGLKRLKATTKEVLLIYGSRHEYLRAVKNIKEHRLLEYLNLNPSGRVSDDLSRAFIRTLSDLRRHQQWRRQMEVIDVVPESKQITDPKEAA